MQKKETPGHQEPDDLVVVGHITGAHGIRGWVRVQPYSEDAETLLTVNEWWLDNPVRHRAEVLSVRPHADTVLAHLSTLNSRNEAEAAQGTTVYISRRLFPELDKDEFYWVDLIGMSVVNLHGEELGVVHDLMDNGVHQVLRIDAGEVENSEKRRERLIPFVSKFVGNIDQNARRITVDWESDY